MKKIGLLVFIVIACASKQSSAQTFNSHLYSIAQSKNGILTGKHVKGDSSFNTTDDTVDIKSLQGINSLGGIYFDKEDEIHTLTPVEFQMVTIHNSDTTILESLSSFLTKDMMASLKGLAPDDKVRFQYIRTKPLPDSETSLYTSPLFFTAR
jgi:hypothetical protein